MVLTAPSRADGDPVTRLPEVPVPHLGGPPAADGSVATAEHPAVAVHLRNAVKPDHLADECSTWQASSTPS